jgi:MFS family permease
MTEHKLPVKQLVILCIWTFSHRASASLLTPSPAICRFAEPIALTSVFPYLPEMMESFGVPENDIARWAGSTSAIFSICQAFTGLLWGAASDKYGRKPILLIGLFNTMLTMLLWGFSTNLPMALVARALQGLGNGNVGILRTTVAELCPWKELQPRAFSVMPLVYTLGAIIGPTFGGGLSNPLQVDPRKPHGDRFLERFPYVLPNIAASVFFAIGIVVGWLFLKETLASKKHHQDLGLRTGARLTAFIRRSFPMAKKDKHLHNEHEPLLGQQKVFNNETDSPLGVASEIVKEDAPKIRDVLTYQTTLNLVVYTLLAFYTLAYDQVSDFVPGVILC